MTGSTAIPEWIAASQFDWRPYPHHYQEWLNFPGSLTQRLRHLSQGKVTMKLNFEGWQVMDANECRPLNLIEPKVWIREVSFYCQSAPWEWARTLIPINSLQGEGAQFMNLGERPIGDILFSDPNLSRSEFEFAQLQPSHQYYQAVQDHGHMTANSIWARRSILYFYQQPLLIYELFLPALFKAIQEE